MTHIHNFFPGPGALPKQVIERVKADIPEFNGTGMSLFELSHRSPRYQEVHDDASARVRRLLDVPENFSVLWLQGGGSMQFAMVPMNLLGGDKSADYVTTGTWSQRAIREATTVGRAREAASSAPDNFNYVPKQLDLDPDAAYVHITANNTIQGTQYHQYPDTGDVPLVADMSSDLMWRPFDVSRFGIVYGGAHKNLGPAGVTIVMIRDDILERCRRDLPTLLSYHTHVKYNSMFNTPVTFAIYFVRYTLQWIEEQGGLVEMERRNRAKAKLLYETVDESGGFYRCPIKPEDRSVMNAVFNLPTPELENTFITQAEAHAMMGLRNLPMRPGCRVSMYNAVSLDSVQVLADFMKEFQRTHG
ncbi:MAG: 3-phosphoserine/phosphohydroxythreonine transaminase [Candidatus Lernaella stagnicola]|nr:3-phosphoserine/phosphohydroxythreonine transaminase [Candidatus Lernaella stagnicola]